MAQLKELNDANLFRSAYMLVRPLLTLTCSFSDKILTIVPLSQVKMVQGSITAPSAWVFFNYEKIRALEGLSYLEHAIVRLFIS